MENTANQNIEGQGAANGELGNRTFTQEEVNALIGKEKADMKDKYADYDELKEKAAKYDEAQEASKTELQKVTDKLNAAQAKLEKLETANKVRGIREKVAKEMNVPAHLLTGSTEEDCKAQAEGIIEYAKPGEYPKVPDGGEPTHTGSKKTRDQFADWMNSQ